MLSPFQAVWTFSYFWVSGQGTLSSLKKWIQTILTFSIMQQIIILRTLQPRLEVQRVPLWGLCPHLRLKVFSPWFCEDKSFWSQVFGSYISLKIRQTFTASCLFEKSLIKILPGPSLCNCMQHVVKKTPDNSDIVNANKTWCAVHKVCLILWTLMSISATESLHDKSHPLTPLFIKGDTNNPSTNQIKIILSLDFVVLQVEFSWLL